MKSSNSSGRSRCSKERAMEEKTKLAELMAEAEFMQQRQMAEYPTEQLRVQEKLAKAKVRSEVYEAMERKGSEVDQSEIIRGSKVEAVIGQQEIMHKHQVKSAAVDGNIQAPTEKISHHYEEDGRAKSRSTMKNTKNTEELSQMMCNLLHHQSAPNVEIEIFTGNPLDYHYFMTVFKEAVEYKIDDPHRRLVRLLKYTEGEARETIKHCIQQPVDIGYDRAKLLLEQHYGDPHRILAAYRKEIKGWPSLKPGDSSANPKFYNFSIKCESIMSRQRWNSLNSPDIICTVTSKLPGNARDKWNRKVLSIRRCRVKDSELADFIDFINDGTLLASDPLFSRETLKVYVEKEEKSHLKKKMKSYASNTTDKVQEEKDDIKEIKCPVCAEKHDLDKCKQFNKMSVDERSKMLRRKRSCYGCYLPVSAEHTAKTFKKRRVCKICAMKHPTGLPGYVPRWKGGGATDNRKDGDSDTLKTNFAEMDVKSVSANMASKIISMCVVPIKVTHAETKREVSTFTMLGNCNHCCFIKAT